MDTLSAVEPRGPPATVFCEADPSLDVSDVELQAAPEDIATLPAAKAAVSGAELRADVSAANAAECAICCEIAAPIAVPCCALSACAGCWNQHIMTRLGERKTELVCMSASCGANLESELRGVLTLETVRQRQRIELARDPSKLCCPREGCPGIVALQGSRRVSCPACSGVYCAECLKPFHRLPSCGLRGRLQLQGWQVGKDCRPCPRCGVLIEKNRGCKHMTCSLGCNHQFCWLCLEPWKDHRCNVRHHVKAALYCNHWALGPAPLRPITRTVALGVGIGAAGAAAAASVVVGPVVLAARYNSKRRERRRDRERQLQRQLLQSVDRAIGRRDTHALLCGDPALVQRALDTLRELPEAEISMVAPTSRSALACLRLGSGRRRLGPEHSHIGAQTHFWWWPSASETPNLWQTEEARCRRWLALVPDNLGPRRVQVHVLADGRRAKQVRAAVQLRATVEAEARSECNVQISVVGADPKVAAQATRVFRSSLDDDEDSDDEADEVVGDEDSAAARIQRAFFPPPKAALLARAVVSGSTVGWLIDDDLRCMWNRHSRSYGRRAFWPAEESLTAGTVILYRAIHQTQDHAHRARTLEGLRLSRL